MSLTATSQSDTLSKTEVDSLIALLPRINTELKDYDLLKQKMYIQFEVIKAMQDKSRTQNALSVRKELKLDSYATAIIQLQASNLKLSTDLKQAKKKKFWRGVENWGWRIGAAALITKLLNVW